MNANKSNLQGVYSPVITPFHSNLNVNKELLIKQCQWLLSQDVGLAIFGTNSEANSLSVDEKIDVLDALIETGIDPKKTMPGTGCCALPDTIKLTQHAMKIGCKNVLMLPPFYYKNVSDEGLFDSYSKIIESVNNDNLRIYLYHIPPIANVAITLNLIEKLKKRYPKIIAGIKDSSGDWNNTLAMLNENWPDFKIFAGSEVFLLKTLQNGGAGCISATANINPYAISMLYKNWLNSDAIIQQENLNKFRNIVQKYPMIPALKSIVGHYHQDTDWHRVRPPLTSLSASNLHSLIKEIEAIGFTMTDTIQISN
ncbi:dihydrodipicolinate synthase family protein [Woeseiaceae bacterium]|nr:dihydrodipicolinate synthase family protein [Woeseiaceae bacterium]